MSELSTPAAAEWPRPAPRVRIHLAGLLPLAGPILLLALFLSAAGPSFFTQDSWVALASGREIAEKGLPHINHLTVLGGGDAWVDQQWLGQLLFYGASWAGGMAGVVLLWMGACLGGFGLAAWTARQRGASPVPLLVTFALSGASVPWGMQARTQVFALPLFSLTLFLLLRDPDARRRSTLWLMPVLCLWANIHGSATLGALLILLYGAQALVRRKSRTIALCCLAAPGALFVSPYITGLPGYYRLMLIDPPFGRSVTEWQRTMPSGATAVFFVLAIASVAVVASRRKRFTVLEFLILGATLVTALDALRGVLWFSLATLAIVPSTITKKAPRLREIEDRGAGALVAVLLLLTVCSIAWRASQPGGSYAGRYPQAAADTVRRLDPPLVYADLSLADWLLWEVPSLRGRISYDVRLELLSRREFDGLVAYALVQPGWRSELKGYPVAVVDQAHADRLVRGGGWREVYENGTVAVAIRLPRP